jgi:tetratricopeptide (TPR) repeat protein
MVHLSSRLTGRLFRGCLVVAFSIGVALLHVRCAAGQSLLETEALFQKGEYDQVAEICGKAIEDGQYGESWRLLKVRADFVRGRYVTALDTLEVATTRYTSSIRLRWLGVQVAKASGVDALSRRWSNEISVLVDRNPWSYTNAASRVTLGRYLFAAGADPRKVLELFFDRAKSSQPSFVDAYIASGELALTKYDYQIAAEEFQRAATFEPENADVLYGLARAFASSDAQKADQIIHNALEVNPRHLPSMLFIAESLIDGERYEVAEKWLARASDVNPEHWHLWALRAVIAHLQADHEREWFCRRTALGWQPLKPDVDYQIGRKLSRHYRFADAVEYQRRALRIDEKFLPAKTQLGQDLLRLGQNDEGWELIRQVAKLDGYNVVTHNLLKLNQKLSKFTTLEADGIQVRMDAREAKIYGPQVVQLIANAREVLCKKYIHELRTPVTIEIFPAQADFAIRTFGLPGGEGFLGVCFGNVITANSPASQGANPANWQSVLWHEFCHVVTLQKTNNKMPRWLSEGISVYEELERDAAWGDTLSAEYRGMILGTELTPVSQLSSAFLKPKSPIHLQFAYYESAMVVRYLVSTYGQEMLLRVLIDLSVGMPINESLQRYTGSLAALDAEFADWIRDRASRVGSDLDWSIPKRTDDASAQPAISTPQQALAWWKDHPNNYFALQAIAKLFMSRGQWDAAIQPLEKLIENFPQERGANSALRLLAGVYRQTGDEQRELALLRQVVREQGNALDEILRLIELEAAAEDWERVAETARRGLAINPLRAELQQALADAAGHLQRPTDAIAAYRALLQLDPIDPAGMHYQLAEQYVDVGQRKLGKRQLLLALEQAPRYRQALILLKQLADEDVFPPNPAPPNPVPPNPAPPNPAPPNNDSTASAEDDRRQGEAQLPDRKETR